MKISIIAAMDEKRGIGKNNIIPWHIREDLIHLRELIKGHVVILGRKTFDAIVFYYNRSGREMPARLYIVVSRDKKYTPARQHAIVVSSLEEVLRLARREEKEEIFIIGGQQIFQQTLHLVDKLYLTLVEGEFQCDTFFPDYQEFKKVVFEESHDNGKYKYRFLELER